MMSVSVARRASPERDDHLWPKRAYNPNDVAEDRVFRPVFVGLFGVLAETEIERAREILTTPIDATSRQQFLRANGAECLAEFVADEVLAAVAAGEREIRRLDVTTAGEPRDELRVFV